MSTYTQQMRLYSMTRMALTLGPGLGFLMYLHMNILNTRPDILDLDNRVRDVPVFEINDTYDFVIVGGGSAGTVLANRLSENPYWNVLLLEAGPDEITITDMPLMFPTLQLSPLDWTYRTEPGDNYCLGFTEGRCSWPRGKVLGGSSVLNAMLYVRGNKRDYDRWEALGNPGWGYKDVLPYFIKSEDIRIDSLKNDKYHGKGGFLSVENYRYHSPIANWFLEAVQELGYKIIDMNGEHQTGFNLPQGTLREGLRCSTAKAFIRPVSKRKNLHVSLHSQVEKILISEEHKQAYGVIFNKFGTKNTVHIRRELILSAGSLASPQLLMLSGVGPADHLKEKGIKVILNSPGVGANLQDHVSVGGATYVFEKPPEFKDKVLSFQLQSVFSSENVDDFTHKKEGPIYWLPVCEVMGFVSTKYQDPKMDWPDIQFFLASSAESSDGGLFGRRAEGLNDEIFTAVYEELIDKEVFTIYTLLLRPKSRGKILLRDKDPDSHVLIYPNYFSHEDDIKVIVEGAKIGHSIAMSRVMKQHNTTFNPFILPACKHLKRFSDEFWACYVKQITLTIYHPVGTAKMGPDNDPTAVVDHRLKVRGIKNLRVVDASVFPYITTGNTNAPVIMIAEKASDMIKEDWGVLDNYVESSENPEILQKVNEKLRVASSETSVKQDEIVQKTPKIKDPDYW